MKTPENLQPALQPVTKPVSALSAGHHLHNPKVPQFVVRLGATSNGRGRSSSRKRPIATSKLTTE